ncbi:hypothetical protein UPYG_G00169250 [Umbra pygmaea]|uniref:Uncharacterized protein n=1 Tax=Umbra pygmaea TaxID=75934 RepID=A0ABD0WN88_UMBPY
MFERKNQKSAKTISDLQKQLAQYNKKLKEIQQHSFGRQPKDVQVNMQQWLKDLGASVRAGISSFAGGMVGELSQTAEVAKAKELVILILKKLNKDVIEDRVEGRSVDAPQTSCINLASSPERSSDDVWSSDSVTGCKCVGAQGGGGMLGQDRSDVHQQLGPMETLLEGLQEMKASQVHMEDAIENLTNQLQSNYSYMKHYLLEERFCNELLEEQLNDLTELHHIEIANFIQALLSMEEKVAYQSEESSREIEEAVDLCMNRITNLETQQQQTLQLERVENDIPRALLGKVINVFLALMAVVLVIISNLANFIAPLMNTKARGAANVLLLLLLFIVWKYWDFLDPMRYAYTEVAENFLYDF